MSSAHRISLAEDILRIVEQGYYTLHDGATIQVSDSIAAARAGTRLYDQSMIAAVPPAVGRLTRMSVTAETTGSAIARLGREPGGHLGALNFASARNPGGGFLRGTKAQEEDLARASTLHACLMTQPSYYERNRAQPSALYLDLAIYSPKIPFFRDDGANFYAPPVECSIITSPAPNAGAVATNQPADLPLIAPTLRRRTEQVLAIAAAEKIDRLILGAWGCGVFRNDPALVAATFAEFLLAGGRFAGAFHEVVFAIYDRTTDRGTLRSFETRFGAAITPPPCSPQKA